MPRDLLFNYPIGPEEYLAGMLGHDTAEAARVVAEQQYAIEDHLASVQLTQSGSSVITAAAGGVLISFPFSFPTGSTPVVVAGIGDNGAAGALVQVVNASVSATDFKADIFIGAVEQVAGSFRVNWIASLAT